MVIDGTIVVALLTVLAAKRAAARNGYPWALAGLFSAASVAFNIAHAPDRPVARLVFAMAPIALVLTTHLLMQQASWRPQQPAMAGQVPHPAAQGGRPPAAPDTASRKRTWQASWPPAGWRPAPDGRPPRPPPLRRHPPAAVRPATRSAIAPPTAATSPPR